MISLVNRSDVRVANRCHVHTEQLEQSESERNMPAAETDERAPTTPGLRQGEVPVFTVKDVDRRPLSTAQLAAGSVVVFVSAHCGDCVRALAELGGISQRALERLVIVCAESARESLSLRRGDLAHARVIADPRNKLRELFGVRSTPTAIHVRGDEMRTLATVPTATGLERLVFGELTDD